MPAFTALTEHISRLGVPFDIDETTVFLIYTDEGAILFDAATTKNDVDTIILPALKAAGISASDVKYIIASHDHSDHAGGIPYLAQHFPDASVAAISDRVGAKTLTLAGGELLCGCIEVVALPGHSKDSLALLDHRTGTLLSADCLQLRGVCKWGTGVGFPDDYFASLSLVKAREDITAIFTSHRYHPLGASAVGRDAVLAYLAECRAAVLHIRDFAAREDIRGLPDDEVARRYNEASGTPPIGAGTVTAIRQAKTL